MDNMEKSKNKEPRNRLAYLTLIFTMIAITILALQVIKKDSAKNAMHVFNVILPVFASWIGTILAFYFGRENFESANKRVQEMVQQINPKKRVKHLITVVMRSMGKLTYYQIPKGKDDKDIPLSELKKLINGDVSRLPVIDGDGLPKYMIHGSSIDKYITGGGKETDTLQQFVAAQTKGKIGFGNNKGFAVVSEETTIGAAKRKMEQIEACQDIFVTKNGSPNEPLTGWASNIRLAKFLEAE